MPIQYYLLKSGLERLEGGYVARIAAGAPLSMEKIIKYVDFSSLTITEEQMREAELAYRKVITFLLSEGYAVDMGIAVFSPSIKGTFRGPDDSFDRNRHLLRIRQRINRKLLKKLRDDFEVKKIERTELYNPRPKTIVDSITGTELLTPGGQVKLTGRELKFDPASVEEGVFLKRENEEYIRIDDFYMREIIPSAITFRMPRTIPPGDYEVEVRRVVNGVLRKGNLSYDVQAAPVHPVPVEIQIPGSKDAPADLLPGMRVRIMGIELNFDSAVSDDGIFLIKDETEVKVPTASIESAIEETLTMTLPEDLESGTWVLEVRKSYGEELRSGSREFEIAVAEPPEEPA